MAPTRIWSSVGAKLMTLRLVSGKRVPRVLVVGSIVLLVLYLVMSDRRNIFTIDASTEIAEFDISDPVLSEWTLGPTKLIEGPLEDRSQARDVHDGSILVIEPGTRVRLQRHGVGEPRIQLVAERGESAGRIRQPDGERVTLGEWAVLLVAQEGRPLVFPFRGRLTAGDDVAVGVSSVLLSGTVSVVEEQLIGETHYIAGTDTLDAGDRVGLWHDPGFGSREPTAAVVSGFVRAEPSGFSEAVNALTLVAHGSADYVRVDRLGTSGYEVHAPPWARFLHDPFLAGATAIVALAALLLELASKLGSLVARDAGAARDDGERDDDD